MFAVRLREALSVLKADGRTKLTRNRRLSFKEYNEALMLPQGEVWEKQYLLSR